MLPPAFADFAYWLSRLRQGWVRTVGGRGVTALSATKLDGNADFSPSQGYFPNSLGNSSISYSLLTSRITVKLCCLVVFGLCRRKLRPWLSGCVIILRPMLTSAATTLTCGLVVAGRQWWVVALTVAGLLLGSLKKSGNPW